MNRGWDCQTAAKRETKIGRECKNVGGEYNVNLGPIPGKGIGKAAHRKLNGCCGTSTGQVRVMLNQGWSEAPLVAPPICQCLLSPC